MIRRFLKILPVLLLVGIAAPAWADGIGDIRSAAAAAKDNRPNDALSFINRAITVGHLSPVELAGAYDLRGNLFDDQGDLVRAIADYDRAIRTNPNFSQAYNDRGIARHDKGDYDGAIADYNRAIKLKPDFAQAYNNRGIAYHKKANDAQAIADYSKAIELNPRYAHAYYNRAIARHLTGAEADAQKDYLTAIRLDSTLEKPH